MNEPSSAIGARCASFSSLDTPSKANCPIENCLSNCDQERGDPVQHTDPAKEPSKSDNEPTPVEFHAPQRRRSRLSAVPSRSS